MDELYEYIDNIRSELPNDFEVYDTGNFRGDDENWEADLEIAGYAIKVYITIVSQVGTYVDIIVTDVSLNGDATDLTVLEEMTTELRHIDRALNDAFAIPF